MPIRPVVASWIVAALVALGVAGSVYRIPIQVSDSLDLLEQSAAAPSLGSAFVDGLYSSTTMLRPMQRVQSRLLAQTGHALGDRYHLAFRGFHAVAAVILIVLFVWICRVHSWTDVAAVTFGLMVLTGLHTFPGLMREAYPTNHYLMVALYGLATFALAQSRGGALTDLAVLVLFVLAVLTLESGVLLWVIALASYVAGMRGISRRGLAALTVLMCAYLVFRVAYLHIGSAGIGERAIGFGAGLMSPAEQIARFGRNPLPLYVYNVSMSFLSVLFSQPVEGEWTITEAIRRGDFRPVFVLEIGSSVLLTTLMLWYAAGHDASGRRRWREPAPLVFAALLVVNTGATLAYAKLQIVSLSGIFYALLGYTAMQALLTRAPRPRLAVPFTIILLVMSSAWAMRAAGLHFKLRQGAFDARTEWALLMRKEPGAADAATTTLRARLSREAIQRRTANRGTFPRWSERWWGED